MKTFRLSPEAALDITEIWDFIAEDNPEAAERVRVDILHAIRELVKMPVKGHQREDLTDQDVLFWTVRNYHIVYRPDKKPLEVVGVLHGALNIPTILKNR